MRLILLGPPGSGKGTQSQYIAERHGIPQISTGDMLRQAIRENSPLAAQVKSYMEKGQLVPDDIIIALVKDRISKPDCSRGYLLDGFPRTVKQAEALIASGIMLDKVIEFVVSDDIVVKRLSGRRVHVPSGRVYHMEFQPPERPNKDDVTGEPLIQREDDNEETVRRRLEVYHQQTEPILTYYEKLASQNMPNVPKRVRIDGSLPPLAVNELISQEL